MKNFRLERLSEAERQEKIRKIEETLTRNNVTLCNDRFFRGIFGCKESEVFLTPFINAVQASAGEKPVVSVTIQNPFQPSKYWKEKEPILDVLAKDESGRLILKCRYAIRRIFASASCIIWRRYFPDR